MRRFFLKMMAAVAVAAVTTQAPVQAAETIRVGYIPVLGSSALFVLDGKGWAKDAGLTLELVRFTSGPQAIQALVAGRIDGYVAGVLPLLQARAHGADVKVVAAASVDELSVIARGPLAASVPADGQAPLSAQATREVFEHFHTTQGRLPRIATQPPGSVPDTLLRYWLKQRVGITDLAAAATIVGVDIDAAQQAFLAGAVDAAVLREPALTVVRRRLPDARIFVDGQGMMPDQPGSVLAILRPTAPDRQGWTKTLTALFVRATTLLSQHPDEAVPYVQKVLGGGLVSEELMKEALEHSAAHFISDPARIIPGVRDLQDFEVAQGLLRKAQPVEDLFIQDLWRQGTP